MATEANNEKRIGGAAWRLMLMPRPPNNSKMMRMLKISLRTGATSATITAAIMMGLNKQTKSTVVAIVGTTPLYQTLTARLSHTPAFVYFVIANSIASGYNLLVLTLGFLLSKWKRYDVTLHIMDMVMMALVATGAAAAVSVAELGKHGNIHTRWSPICDKFDEYCHRSGLALISAFIGTGLLIALNAHSIITLHKDAASQL